MKTRINNNSYENRGEFLKEVFKKSLSLLGVFMLMATFGVVSSITFEAANPESASAAGVIDKTWAKSGTADKNSGSGRTTEFWWVAVNAADDGKSGDAWRKFQLANGVSTNTENNFFKSRGELLTFCKKSKYIFWVEGYVPSERKNLWIRNGDNLQFYPNIGTQYQNKSGKAGNQWNYPISGMTERGIIDFYPKSNPTKYKWVENIVNQKVPQNDANRDTNIICTGSDPTPPDLCTKENAGKGKYAGLIWNDALGKCVKRVKTEPCNEKNAGKGEYAGLIWDAKQKKCTRPVLTTCNELNVGKAPYEGLIWDSTKKICRPPTTVIPCNKQTAGKSPYAKFIWSEPLQSCVIIPPPTASEISVPAACTPAPPTTNDPNQKWVLVEEIKAPVSPNPYSWVTSIERHDLSGYEGTDPIGENNLHDQAPDVSVNDGSRGFKKTEYGKEMDKIANGYYKNSPVSVVQAAIARALQIDATATHAHQDLDGANKKGMAEGGILDIVERTKYYEAQLCQRTDELYVLTPQPPTPIYNNEGKIVDYRPNPPIWIPQGITKTAYDHKSSFSSLKDTGFWQMISVHCNEKDFQKLVSSTGATVQNAGNSMKKIAAVAYSKKYDSLPSSPDFGLGDSGELGFFTKECPYDCKAQQPGLPATKTEPKYGAGSGGNLKATPEDNTGKVTGKGDLNGNKFTFFRDNQYREIVVNTWEPVVGGPVGNIGEVLSTTITRDKQGTPGVLPGENGNGGQFSMIDKNGEVIFETENSESPTVQINNFGNKSKNEYFTGSESTQVEGLADGLKIKSTWASTEGYPNIFNIKYEYAPIVTTTFSGIQIGFSSEGKRDLGSVVTDTAAVEGKCYAEFGKNTQTVDTKEVFYNNTGDGSKNELDGNLLQDYIDEFRKPDNGVTTNLLVRFVRATTE